MAINFHIHVAQRPEDNCPDLFLRGMDEAGIERAVVLSGGPSSDGSVFHLGKSWPDRFVPFPSCRLGLDTPATVREKAARGAAGFKVIRPGDRLNHPRFDEAWGAMEELGRPVLVHCANKALERPDLLGDVAERFPRLLIVAAHIGYPWYEEGCLIARLHPNVYCDTSTDQVNAWDGSGRLLLKPVIAKLDYYLDPACRDREVPWDKFVFGTDGRGPLSERDVTFQKKIMDHYRELFSVVGLSPETQRRILHSNAERILSGRGLEGG